VQIIEKDKEYTDLPFEERKHIETGEAENSVNSNFQQAD
jgi:hypothetical protein